MPYGLIDSQTLKDRATQLLIKYRSGALVTQFFKYLLRERISFGLFDSFFGEQEFFYQHQMTYDRQNSQLRNLFSFFSHKRTAFSIRIYRNSCCPTKKRILFGLFDSFKGDRELYNYLSREMIGRDRGRNRWRRGPRNGRRASVGAELDR